MEIPSSENSTPATICHIYGSNVDSQVVDYEKKRVPRKILHFSDGTLEEYSTDEDDEQPKIESILIDPKSLSWSGWFGHWAKHTGKTALDTCDSVGGSIANFLGITSPKYFYEIEEYNRIMKEDADEKMKVDAEMAGWSSPREQEVSTQEIYKISSGTDLPLSQFGEDVKADGENVRT